MPWWGIVLIVLASLVVGGVFASVGVMIYIGRGLWQ